MVEAAPNAAGVYLIANKATGKVYVGSARRIRSRLQSHRTKLRAGEHHSVLLQRAWDKHGEQVFVASVLVLCDVAELRDREQLAIDAYGAADRDHGYNLNPKTVPGRCLPHSEETKRKIGAGNKGKGGRRSQLGRPLAPGSRAALRHDKGVAPSRKCQEAAWAASRGNKYHLGHTHDAATRERMSEKTRGSRHPKSVLSEDAVREIRASVGQRGAVAVLAKKFGVSMSTVYETRRGRYWKHIGAQEKAQ
jgi:group I intron endonuclease